MPADLSFAREPDDDAFRAAAARRAEVAALRREHDGYQRQGRADRAGQVAAVLDALGAPLRDAAESAPRERAVPKRARS